MWRAHKGLRDEKRFGSEDNEAVHHQRHLRCGKPTVKDELAAKLDAKRYACVDSDEVGLNRRG